jgi:hypothetical protein
LVHVDRHGAPFHRFVHLLKNEKMRGKKYLQISHMVHMLSNICMFCYVLFLLKIVAVQHLVVKNLAHINRVDFMYRKFSMVSGPNMIKIIHVIMCNGYWILHCRITMNMGTPLILCCNYFLS